MEKKHVIQRVACLCHPDAGVRTMAADQLEKAQPMGLFPRVPRASPGQSPVGQNLHQMIESYPAGIPRILPQASDAGLLERVLNAFEIPLKEACAGWVEMLQREGSIGPAAAAGALAQVEYRPAIPALLRQLREAPPFQFVHALYALGQMGVAEAAPQLAAFAVFPFQSLRFVRRATTVHLPDEFLGPLVRAYQWHHRSCGERGLSPDAEALRARRMAAQPDISLGEHGTGGDIGDFYSSQQVTAPRWFACHALATMGEDDALQILRALQAGEEETLRRVEDPRLFPALFVGLIQRPKTEAEERCVLAAIRGLEALGDERALAALTWFGHSWLPLRAGQVLERESRAAAGRLRERLEPGRRELVPSAGPPGGAGELAAAEGGSER